MPRTSILRLQPRTIGTEPILPCLVIAALSLPPFGEPAHFWYHLPLLRTLHVAGPPSYLSPQHCRKVGATMPKRRGNNAHRLGQTVEHPPVAASPRRVAFVPGIRRVLGPVQPDSTCGEKVVL